MKFKALFATLAALPVLATAQTYLYIPTQEQTYDIDGISGGGPFLGEILSGPNKTDIGNFTFFCDSIPQEFYLGQTFQVKVETLNTGTTTSLDPWVITEANSEAAAYDKAYGVSLSTEQINTAIQGSIWSLDGQISGPITSSDAESASFANYLVGQAKSVGTYVTGYARYDAGINYSNPNNPSGVNGQTQIAAVPEPSPLLALGVPMAAFMYRRRRAGK